MWTDKMRPLAGRWLLFAATTVTSMLWSDPASAQVLDRIEINETPTQAEIHIVFNTRALYLRHTPSDRGDRLSMYLDFPDIDRSRRFARELAASPPSDVVPKFTVTFPDAANSLTVKFAKSVRFKVAQREMRNSSRIVIVVPLEARVGPTPAVIPPPPPEGKASAASPPAAQGGGGGSFEVPAFRPGMDVNKYAEELMALGRAAMTAENHSKAVEIFNALLNLPPNRHTQDAQEMVGLARERSGEVAKAKLEYEQYLKMYPGSEGAVRVRQRLAALSDVGAQAQRRQGERRVRKIEETRVYGSIYQYYYGGYSQTKSTDKTTNTTTSTDTHDQSLLISSFDVTGRSRKDEYDNKVVVRGTQSYDLLAMDDSRRNISRLRAAYLEHSKQESYLLRVGRQPGNTGGVLDYRFDGAWFRYTVSPQLLNVNLIGGQPRQFSLDSRYVPDDPRNFRAELNRYFYGANVDIGPVGDAWSGNAYFVNQMVNGVVDRRAVGSEVRYSSNGRNAFGLIDYDISYGVLNVAMLNGTWASEKTTFTLLADHRRTPYLQTTNALFGSGFTSTSVINTTNEGLLREQAKQVTATSDLFLVGVLRSVSKSWQLGGDVRMNRISGTSASNCLVILPGTSTLFINPNATTDAPCSLQALPGTGNIWTYTLQAIGADIPFDQSTVVMNASYISSDAYRGESVTLNMLGRLGQQWQIDTFLILYHQKDSSSVELYRATPTLRVDYRLRDAWTLEGSGGIEKTWTDSPVQKDSTLREFFFFGVRWDFS